MQTLNLDSTRKTRERRTIQQKRELDNCKSVRIKIYTQPREGQKNSTISKNHEVQLPETLLLVEATKNKASERRTFTETTMRFSCLKQTYK